MHLSPQLNFMFDWDTPWENVREETISTEGESDQFVLAIGTVEFTALGFANEAPPEELIETAIDVHSRNDGFEVAAETPIGDGEISTVETVTTVPSATLT